MRAYCLFRPPDVGAVPTVEEAGCAVKEVVGGGKKEIYEVEVKGKKQEVSAFGYVEFDGDVAKEVLDRYEMMAPEYIKRSRTDEEKKACAGLLAAAVALTRYKREGHAEFERVMAGKDERTRNVAGLLLKAVGGVRPPQRMEDKAMYFFDREDEINGLDAAVDAIEEAYAAAKGQKVER